MTNTWTIRRQMLVSYLIAVVFVLVTTVLLVLVNFSQLKKETVQQMEDALVDQANDNISALLQQGGNYVATLIAEVTTAFEFLSLFFSNMDNDQTFSLDFMENYTYRESMQKCNFTNPDNNYGDQGACFEFAVYYLLGSPVADRTLDKVSRYNLLWKHIHLQTQPTVLRYFIFLEKSNFFVVYPGTYISLPQLPGWFSEYEKNRTLFSSSVYPDGLGNRNNTIISIAAPFFDQDKEHIGVISADILVEKLDDNLADLNYMGESTVYLVYRDGEIIKADHRQRNKKTIQDVVGVKKWAEMTAEPNKTHFYFEQDDLYRLALTPITASFQGVASEPWFYLTISIKESKILKYQHKAAEYIESLGMVLFGIILGIIGVAVAATITLVHFLAKRIEEPLIGIVKFMKNLNATATGNSQVNPADLDALKSGEDQVAELVTAYKKLGKDLIMQQEDPLASRFWSNARHQYPVNELYGKPVPWEWRYQSFNIN